MPWMIVENDAQYCVYKKDEEDQPTGESLGCHETRDDAEAQLAALYASEEDTGDGDSMKADGQSYTYNDVTCRATKRQPSDRDDKKYMRTVTYGDKTRVVHYGDPDMPMRRNNEERQANFLARHNCNQKTDPFAPGFWACLDWQRTDEKAIEPDSATIADWLENRFHTYTAGEFDNLFGLGAISRAEREALNKAISLSLEAFNERLQDDDLISLRVRSPWDEYDTGSSLAQKAIELAVKEHEDAAAILSGMGGDATKAAEATDDDTVVFAAGPVKALSANRVGGYGVLWGNRTRPDLTGEYFDRDTEELQTVFKAMGRLPVLYHHAMNPSLKTAVVGVIDRMAIDDMGLWMEAELQKANEYADAIGALVQAGALGWSTGTLPGARKVAPDGKIVRWPIVEGTLTPTPAEPRNRIELPVKLIKSAFADLGLADQLDELLKGTEDVRAERERQLAIERERIRLLALTI